MDDLISRQAAIKAICEDGTMLERQGKYTMTMVERKQKDVDILDTLPSAQPVAKDINVPVKDCVSRQTTIDAIEGVDWYHQNENGEMVHGANSAEHQAWYKAEDIYAAIEGVPPAQPVEDARAMCGECDAWNQYKNYPQPEQFNPCTVCQEFDCTGCKFRRT